MQITGVILAGGLSSRFGSDKAQALYCGHSFISLAYDLLKSICDEVIISGQSHNLSVEGLVCMPDITPGGPMAGIASVIKQLDAQWLLIIPCDMPLLTRQVLLSTIEASDSKYTVVWKENSGKIQPFPMFLNRKDGEKALKEIGNGVGLSIKLLLMHLPFISLPILPKNLQLFSNINTKLDLEKLCHR